MKDIYKEESLSIPDGVWVRSKARIIRVKGPRGELVKDLSHIEMEIKKVSPTELRLVVWHGTRKHVACLRTVRTLISNMITGVTKGYRYRMRYVYAHFPINLNLISDGKEVEIRNFLGEKRVRIVKLLPNVNLTVSTTTKDEITLEGISLENVSQTAASIQQICNVRNKDIRKFLDGIYVSAKETIEES